MGQYFAYELTEDEASLWRQNPREVLRSYRPCASARARMLGFQGVRFLAPNGEVLAELRVAQAMLDARRPMA
jgi:ribosomal protein L15E